MTKQDLTLVGLSEDKTSVILVSDSGEEFRLAADSKLRAALRGENARIGQLEIQMESALRPRDIQSRIRSGDTPEAVAAAAQTTVDRIMTFAMPVLAERAHVAERAQKASVRRPGGDGPGGILGETAGMTLRTIGIHPDDVVWDAWRRDDGRWSLTASFGSGPSRKATFVYDSAGRYVIAENDESRWLVGEAGEPGERTPARTRRTPAGDEQLPLGEDAIELVSETGPVEAQSGVDTRDTIDDTADLTDVRAARSLRSVPAPVEDLPISGSDHGDADWMVTQATERPAPAQREPEAQAEPPIDAEPAADEPAPKRKGRASVPSWDEIMFGSGRD